MKTFRTDVRMTPSLYPIGLQNRVLTVGSCFADAIGKRLDRFKFDALINPFGVIYNPVSIHKVLLYGVRQELPPEHSYIQQQEVHLNHDFHSEVSSLEKAALSDIINNKIIETHQFLKSTEWLLITYGTAWVYHRKDTNEVVANCHKIPANMFIKSMLTGADVVDSFEVFYRELKALNPAAKIILTLSPVRHVKDTLELNSVSKSVLRVACHHIATKFESVEYFPAYEIMMDDLRDYRFYKADMLHPTEEAEEYIWEKFSEKYFTSETKAFLNAWSGILSALAHRPFHSDSSAHKRFLNDTLRKLQELQPRIDVSAEIAYVEAQLK